MSLIVSLFKIVVLFVVKGFEPFGGLMTVGVLITIWSFKGKPTGSALTVVKGIKKFISSTKRDIKIYPIRCL
ncbi:hypothetical protein NBRC111452_2369 [Companilactobacillus farciminis]|nr:hypothetical protein NBRC111452_2369 [Companilactobacillus farciminis]